MSNNKIAPKIAIHYLRSLSANVINRGGDGLPKIVIFGDVPRARGSSQCQKKSWRDALRADNLPTSMRTREAGILLLDPLIELGHDAESAWNVVQGFLPLFIAGVAKNEKSKKNADEAPEEKYQTQVVMALSPEEIKAIVEGLHNNFESALMALKVDKEGNVTVEKGSPLHKLSRDLTERFNGWVGAIDIALWGRMLTVNHNMEVRAASQVAHMITTNAYAPQEDYFTATDNLSRNAAMIGQAFYASGTYYQVIVVDPAVLLANLGHDQDLQKRALRALLQVTALVLPGGKQNTFFADTVPGLMLVEARPAAYSLASAFDTPVSGAGALALSARALANYWPMANNFAGVPLWTGLVPGTPAVAQVLADSPLKAGENVTWYENLDQIIDAVLLQVP